MSTIIGKRTEGGTSLHVDVQRLVETKLLVQANSGGGKSYLLRKLLETTHGKVQHIVLDMEGEFGTLREKYDYVLAGKGGDIPADPRTAELLARKTLELGCSLIVDLYELKAHERIRFVKLFLDAMINAPKELWHEVLVVIDEAHVFAPEKGHAESLGSVVDLASRGRKRGYSAILATQRLSKLHKDVAAECGNKLIGRTGLDIDMKRAAEELGFSSKADMLSLRELDPGEFYAFGPALQAKGVTKMRVGQVETKHPKAGQRLKAHAPAPTEKVRQILSKLTDLPKEAQEELRDRSSLQARVKELERELRAKPKDAPAPKAEEIAAIKKRCFEESKKENFTWLKNAMRDLDAHMKRAFDGKLEELKKAEPAKPTSISDTLPRVWRGLPVKMAEPNPETTRVMDGLRKHIEGDDKPLGKCERAILRFMAPREGRSFNKIQVATRSSYSQNSSGFQNAIGALVSRGLIARTGGGDLQITAAGISTANDLGLLDQPEEDPIAAWLRSLGKAERTILEVLLKEPEDSLTKETLSERTNYSVNSSGFQNAIGRLCSLGLAVRTGGGLRLNPDVVNV